MNTLLLEKNRDFDFNLTEHQNLIKNKIIEIKNYFTPDVKKNIELLINSNLIGINIPEVYGGMGNDFISTSVLLEIIAQKCINTAITYSNYISSSIPVLFFGTEGQKEEILPLISKGKVLSLTESENLKFNLDKKTDNFILNGFQTISNIYENTDLFIILAKNKQLQTNNNIKFFIVKKNTYGLNSSKKGKSINNNLFYELLFNNCVLHKTNLIGDKTESTEIEKLFFITNNINISSISLGSLQNLCYFYQNHIKLNNVNEEIKFAFIDLYSEIEIARLLTYQACNLFNKNIEATTESSMAKLYTIESTIKHLKKVIQIFNNYGYTTDYSLIKFKQDLNIFKLYIKSLEKDKIVINNSLGVKL